MENKFECGNGAFLRVSVCAVYNEGSVYDYDVSYLNHDTGEEELIPVIEEQLATIEEVVECEPNIDWQATYNEYSEKAQRTIASLSKRITELNETVKACTESENIVRTNFTAKCDEIMVLKSENERLSKQNEELGKQVDDLEAGVNNATRIADNAVETAQNKEKLITEQRELIKKYGMVIDILIDKIVALKKGENNG